MSKALDELRLRQSAHLLLAALQELVELKDMKDNGGEDSIQYRHRKPVAWPAARAAIAAATEGAAPAAPRDDAVDGYREFWEWLPRAYRDGDQGDAPRFTKYNMMVAFQAGRDSRPAAPLPEPVDNETYTDEKGTVWTRPTAWAYAQACKARDAVAAPLPGELPALPEYGENPAYNAKQMQAFYERGYVHGYSYGNRRAALSAAQPAQPVAETVVSAAGGSRVHWYTDPRELPPGVKFYAAPAQPAQEDQDAERYRWLCERVEFGEWSIGRHVVNDSFGGTRDEFADDKSDADSMIDAARGAQP